MTTHPCRLPFIRWIGRDWTCRCGARWTCAMTIDRRVWLRRPPPRGEAS